MNTEILTDGCEGMMDLEAFCAKRMHNIHVLRALKKSVDEDVIYDITQEKLQPYDDKSRCHATASIFGIFDLVQPEERDLDLLFSQLKALSRRYRARNERRLWREGR